MNSHGKKSQNHKTPQLPLPLFSDHSCQYFSHNNCSYLTSLNTARKTNKQNHNNCGICKDFAEPLEAMASLSEKMQRGLLQQRRQIISLPAAAAASRLLLLTVAEATKKLNG
jgi:hypothetical protein